MSLSSIDDDEIRKIPELESLEDTSHHDFPMRCIVIYHTRFECFDLVFLIPTRVRFTIRDEDTRSIRELSMCMRYIIALEGDLSFLRYYVAESCEDIRHVTPRQSRVLESGELRLICVFSDLVLSEVQELFASTDRGRYDIDSRSCEELEKCSICDILRSDKRLRETSSLIS